ncbi:MAG: 16S rRNA (guanine(527)-N(7))-methyltransferase RsmG [Phycisphaerales bacterium JB059]
MNEPPSAQASTDAPSDSQGEPSPAERPSYLDAPPLSPPEGFAKACGEAGVSLTPDEIDRLSRYMGMLLAANKAFNLTAIRDPGVAWTRHVLDSLTLLGVIAEIEAPEGRPLRVIDVGTGGGLPGIPLAIARPDVSVTLLDATAKKCAFLGHVTRELDLNDVEVVCARAEAAGRDRGERTSAGRSGGRREAYDLVVARAVGRLPTLCELTVPFARVGGLIALIKGAQAEEELAEAKGALHLLHAAHAGTAPTGTGRIVVLEKQRPTPKLYPRRDGEPKRAPLGVASK